MLTSTSHAEQIITLKDGSQLRGELVSVMNGIYTVQTPAMGQVTLNKESISSISENSSLNSNQASNTQNFDQQFKEQQNKILSNPDRVADIQAMANDPEIMQLLSDPALLQSVTSRDVDAIKSNPKTQALLNNPKIQALIEKLQESNPQ